MAQPLLIEILTYAPTAFYHCMHCEVAWQEAGVGGHVHEEQMQNSLPPDLARDYQEVSDWVRELAGRYGPRVLIKVIDAASIEGFLSALRYGIRRYPAVVVDHRRRFADGDLQAAGREVDRLLTERSV